MRKRNLKVGDHFLFRNENKRYYQIDDAMCMWHWYCDGDGGFRNRSYRSADSKAIADLCKFDRSMISYGYGGCLLKFRDLAAACGDSEDIDIKLQIDEETHRLSLTSYGTPKQDKGIVERSGQEAIKISNNGWKKIHLGGYFITRNTVLEFDFRSRKQGQSHVIGFDRNNFISSKWGFQIFGKKIWGDVITEFKNYTDNGLWQHYQVPVGKHYQGYFDFLYFSANDDQFGLGESEFRNIRIYGGRADP